MKNSLLSFLLMFLSLTAWAQEFSVGNFHYVVTDGANHYVSVAQNPENAPTGAVVIPSSVTHNAVTYTVTSIAESAFNWNTSITGVMIPNTVTSIDNYAFFGCESLASFSVPGSVTTIGAGVFDYCSIPTFTFEASNTAITLGTEIPCTDHLYLYRDINMEGTLTTSIKKLTIGANVTTIYNGMFTGSNQLNSIDFSAATGVTSIGENAFGSCGTFDGSDEEPASHLTTVDLSKTKVTSIGHSAFNWCSKLTAITLPSTLTSIGDYAFYGCESLASFSVPGSVTTIGARVFDYCSIPTFTFEASNTAITIGSGIPCTAHLYLYRDVNMEGTLANGMKKLTVGANVTTIYNNMFNGSFRLNSIDFSAATGLTSIGENAFGSCGTFDGSDEEPASHLTTVDLSKTKVTSIGHSAFNWCSKLTAITLPSTLTSIGDYAFSGCESLASFSVPGSVTTIGARVFDYCSIPTFTFEASNTTLNCASDIACSNILNMYRNVNFTGGMSGGIKKLIIGDAVTSIGTTFSWCNDITDITVPWVSSPIVIADDAFADDIYANATLWIPGGTKDIYGNAGGWKKFSKNDFSSYVVNFTGSAHGTLAVGRIVSTNNEPQTIRIDRETNVVFKVTPATGYELAKFTVNGETKAVTEGQYTVTNLLADQTVVANFTAISYTISYDLDGGSVAEANPTTYNVMSDDITLNNPTKTGYTFKGWKLNGEGDAQMTVTIPTGTTGNMAYAATWQVNQYTITFNSNGGSTVDAITQDYGTGITPPDNPARPGFNFAGWNPALPKTMPAENMTLVALWTEAPKCATPTISIVEGKLHFSCETEGVTYISHVEMPSSFNGDSEDIDLPKIKVTVYAMKEGLGNSDIATKEISISGTGAKKGDVNEDGIVNGTDIQEVINIIVAGD